jgi:hypothetical protein
MRGKKRKSTRIGRDKDGEASLPVKKTKDLAERQKKVQEDGPSNPHYIGGLGENDEGKELFDDLLKKMSSPDNQ